MKLFLGTNCPQCEALKKPVCVLRTGRHIDLDQVPDLEVHLIADSGVPTTEDEAAALSEADYHDIYSVPALVSGGRTVRDVFDILDELQGAMEGGRL